MGDVLGSLMGGGGTQQASGLDTIISLLEKVTGSGQQAGPAQPSLTSSDSPIMSLVKPFITPLAKKLKISPELAMIVVSFVLQKLLAHHPTSGRDSTQFNLDQLLNQLNTGKLDPNMIKSSGMVEELSQVTGMDQSDGSQEPEYRLHHGGQARPDGCRHSPGKNSLGWSEESLSLVRIRS